MERESNALKRRYLFVLDLVLTGAAFLLAYTFKLNFAGGLTSPGDYLLVLALIVLISGLSFHMFGLYEPDRHLDALRIFASIVKAVLTTISALLILLYLVHQGDVSRFLIGFFVIFNVALLFAVRLLRSWRHCRSVASGRCTKEILIVGSHERAKDLIRYLSSMSHYGYRILGCLETDDSRFEEEVAEGVMIIGEMADFKTFLLNFAVDEIVFAMPLRKIDGVMEHIAFAEELGINIRILPDWQIHQLKFQPSVAALNIEDFAGMPTMSLSSVSRRVFQLTLKDALDRCSAFLGLLALSPLFAYIAVTIKLTSKGPVFFKQERSGLNGRTFQLYKFRSMVVNAEELRKGLEDQNEQEGPVFKIAKDPRITWIGSLLRKTSLDELPQLINVLKGEMSLVGPRPPLPAEVEQYDPWQRRRLSMKPGITCIWQVSGRNQIGFEQWMRMDLEYIDKWSLSLDFKLLLKTLPAVVFGTGH